MLELGVCGIKENLGTGGSNRLCESGGRGLEILENPGAGGSNFREGVSPPPGHF